MLVNNPPESALHIQLIVEDSEERLTDEQVNEILEFSKQWLIKPKEEDEFGDTDTAS
jgi:DNA-directed RNA polymerase subunit F